MKKAFILFCIFFLCTITVSAEDVITKKNGKQIKGNIESVGDEYISYSTISTDGEKKTWLIDTFEVRSIVFENGYVQTFSEESTSYNNARKKKLIELPQSNRSIQSSSTPTSRDSSSDKESINSMYLDASFVMPLISNGSDYSKWGLDFGLGFQKSLSDIAFLSIPLVDLAFSFVNSKKYDVKVTNFYYTWPVQVGLGKEDMNFRFGGFIGGASSTVRSKTIGDSKNSAFAYGLKFNAKLFVDIGFELIWTSGSNSPGKLLTVGFRF